MVYAHPLNNHFPEPVISYTSCAAGMVNKMWIPSPALEQLSYITLVYIIELIKLQLKILYSK